MHMYMKTCAPVYYIYFRLSAKTKRLSMVVCSTESKKGLCLKLLVVPAYLKQFIVLSILELCIKKSVEKLDGTGPNTECGKKCPKITVAHRNLLKGS